MDVHHAENSAASALLATYCALCGLKLRDARSVECGVGPDCRKAHGYDAPNREPNWDAAEKLLEGVVLCNVALTSEPAWRSDARAFANRVIVLIAIEQTGPAVIKATNALCVLGFEKVAVRVAGRLAKIKIELEGEGEQQFYVVRAPYSEGFLRTPGRKWDGVAKVTRFHKSFKAPLFAALERNYQGHVALGPKGLFQIAG
ncbi:MAG: hypothetical protein HUU21_09475 [Polyangiaceae bacterium]|nr:hypothetical protein [Polyangiaceae bacterium]